MTYQIIIKYKTGTTLFIDVPENYYQNKYSKKPEAKLHKIFMKEYKKFTSSLKSNQNIIDVSKYLKFSNATITTKDILGIDLKPISKDQIEIINNTYGAYDKVYLDIKDTSLNDLIKKLDVTLDSFNDLIKQYIESKSQLKQTRKKPSVKKEVSNLQAENNPKIANEEMAPTIKEEVKE